LPEAESTAQSPSDGGEARMFHGFFRTLVKVMVASLVVGAIMTHFGVTPDQFMKATGFSEDRLIELARQGLNWAVPNLLLGALIIVPVWFLIFLFRPPRARNE
jgi:hypothetical protein